MTSDAEATEIDAKDAVVLHLISGATAADEADAVDFLRASGLPLSSVVLGLLDQSDDCIKIIGTDGSLQFMNCNGKRAMQIDDFCVVAGRPWPSLWPEESQPLVESSVGKALEGQQVRFEAFCPTAKGDPRWWEVTVSPVRAPDGRVSAILSTSRDVTERRQREEAAATVALEMRHRLRNAHSVGAAVLLASGQSEPQHLDFARAVASRLAHLSDVHAKLVDVGGGLSLAAMCEDVAQVFSQSGGQLHCDGLPDVHLDEDRARAISLVLGELTTNSLKHGALGRGGDARLAGDHGDGLLSLTWTEEFDSDLERAPPASSGQGKALMNRILGLYRGQFDSERNAQGFQARITLPL